MSESSLHFALRLIRKLTGFSPIPVRGLASFGGGTALRGSLSNVGPVRNPPEVQASRFRTRDRMRSRASSSQIYPALSVMVATVTCGQRTPLKIKITSCEY
jgi:hypothetical protein